MNYAEAVIALENRVNDDSYGVNVVNFIYSPALHIGLSVYSVNALYAAGDVRVGNLPQHAVAYLLFDIVQKSLTRLNLRFERGGNLLIRNGIEIADCKVLKLLLERSDTESVSDGRINFKRFARFEAALFLGHKAQCAHIMDAVGKLYDNDPYIAAHCKEHFADILALLLLHEHKPFFLGCVVIAVGFVCGYLTELCDSVNELLNGFAEFFTYLLVGNGCILNNVMKQRGAD